MSRCLVRTPPNHFHGFVRCSSRQFNLLSPNLEEKRPQFPELRSEKVGFTYPTVWFVPLALLKTFREIMIVSDNC